MSIVNQLFQSASQGVQSTFEACAFRPEPGSQTLCLCYLALPVRRRERCLQFYNLSQQLVNAKLFLGLKRIGVPGLAAGRQGWMEGACEMFKRAI